MKNRTVGIYARTSTLDQAKGMESQLRALRLYCERNNITNTKIFADEGISGGKASRPALYQL